MAMGALYQIVQRQADMMAFIDIILPIVFLLKRTPLERGRSRSGQPAGSHAG